jgi:hypothetical protein
MFTSPDEDMKVNDIVEVYGQVIRRYMVTGDPVINCVIIRKITGHKDADLIVPVVVSLRTEPCTHD